MHSYACSGALDGDPLEHERVRSVHHDISNNFILYKKPNPKILLHLCTKYIISLPFLPLLFEKEYHQLQTPNPIIIRYTRQLAMPFQSNQLSQTQTLQRYNGTWRKLLKVSSPRDILEFSRNPEVCT